MPDSIEINETDLDILARDFGKGMPEDLKAKVLDGIRKASEAEREMNLKKFFEDLETEQETESPEV